MENSITILLVEDHEITRLGMRTMIEQMQNTIVVDEADSGRAAIKKAQELRPALVLMDIGLPDIDGIKATKQIKEMQLSKVILITSHDNDDDILAGLSAGADAYCLKGISSAQLSHAVYSVMGGAVWLDPDIAKQVVRLMQGRGAEDKLQLPAQPKSSSSPIGNPFQLSEREYDVLCLLVDGMSNQQIANRLYLSAETVKSHMRHLMEKLRVSDRTQAAVKAVKEGLVPMHKSQ